MGHGSPVGAQQKGAGLAPMPVQRSQGKRRPQVPRADELPQGFAQQAAPKPRATAQARMLANRKHGAELPQDVLSEAASELGRAGGLAKAAQDRGLRVLVGLGLRGVVPEILGALPGRLGVIRRARNGSACGGSGRRCLQSDGCVDDSVGCA